MMWGTQVRQKLSFSPFSLTRMCISPADHIVHFPSGSTDLHYVPRSRKSPGNGGAYVRPRPRRPSTSSSHLQCSQWRWAFCSAHRSRWICPCSGQSFSSLVIPHILIDLMASRMIPNYLVTYASSRKCCTPPADNHRSRRSVSISGAMAGPGSILIQ